MAPKLSWKEEAAGIWSAEIRELDIVAFVRDVSPTGFRWTSNLDVGYAPTVEEAQVDCEAVIRLRLLEAADRLSTVTRATSNRFEVMEELCQSPD